METENSNKVLQILRWISILPIAIIAAWLGWYIINILGRISLGMTGITPDDFIGKLYYITAGHGVIGGVFVYVGAKLAPTHRMIITFVLGGICIAASGFLLFPAIMIKDWWAFLGGIFVIVGAGAVVWSVYSGEIVLE